MSDFISIKKSDTDSGSNSGFLVERKDALVPSISGLYPQLALNGFTLIYDGAI